MTTTRRLHVVDMAAAPEPPYPADTKANGYNLEFDVQRIEASDTWALASSDERAWLLRIWYEAQKTVPMGSMQANLEVFAARIGCTRQFLEAHREVLLRGWVLHTDGRLYHDYIVSRVQAMLEKRVRVRDKVRRYREKKQELDSDVTVTPGYVTVSNRRNRKQEQEFREEPSSLCPPEKKSFVQEPCVPPASEKKSRNKKFLKPTVNEVAEYCRQRRNGIDPQYFWDTNEGKGWLVGNTKTPMRDWQAVVRTWEKNRETYQRSGKRETQADKSARFGDYLRKEFVKAGGGDPV